LTGRWRQVNLTAMKAMSTERSPLHVIVAGGGIAGLCLAQGLRAPGIDVQIHERDGSPAARAQGTG
jgi:cation diffusion facilitator CzcD-associated flavoprotein CzcO